MRKTALITGTSSGLGKTTAKHLAVNGWNVVAGDATLADYEAFAASVNAIFAGLRASRTATEEDVAKVIFAAATDGTDQLRYVATEDIKPLVKARHETSEREYIAFMRLQFLPNRKRPAANLRIERLADANVPE
jgi:NAD(P)-dependent dehydrogenase (short-subunit alcohol dehydrogenase family)